MRPRAELETWLLDWNELGAALSEESARRYIAMTCHTEDEQGKQACVDFIEQIHPQAHPGLLPLAGDRGRLPALNLLASGHTRAERADAWLALMKRFGCLVDWTGHERVHASLWHDVGHIFRSPFH